MTFPAFRPIADLRIAAQDHPVLFGTLGSRTPPSEVNRPPSKAAVTFLRWIAGNEIRGALSIFSVGVTGGIFCPVQGMASTPNFLFQNRALRYSRQHFSLRRANPDTIVTDLQ
jgi:hypothetical protein